MKIAVFLNALGLGGTEKAACRWAQLLRDRDHSISVLSLEEGPRRAELEKHGIPLRIVVSDEKSIREYLAELRPDVIHTHAPGYPHAGDVLGRALAHLPKIPVVQTNIFGRLDNPEEDTWTDSRLFISWTSSVQAARRTFRSLDQKFFQRASVASYPLDAEDGPARSEIDDFRRRHGIAPDEVLFGRLSRPEPNKWTDLPIESFRIAAARQSKIKLLLREPPAPVREALEASPDRTRFIILPATNNATEIALTLGSLDAVLHTSIIGESFGYGIAEPMNYAKPVIANSTPWQDQAQIELVRHGECGFIASTPGGIADAMVALANNPDLRAKLGRNAQEHIRQLADPGDSIERVEEALRLAISNKPNPHAAEDSLQALSAAHYLDHEQFGHTWREQMALRPLHYRVRFHQWRRVVRSRIASH